MHKLHFTKKINAPVEKVWHAMLDDSTYREWTEAFNPEPGVVSYMEGSWDKGSQIRFIGEEKDGTKSGMFARIAENRPNEFLSIQHLGEIRHDVETPWPAGTPEFYENYTLKEVDGGTELTIDVDTVEEYKEMFEGMWPKALDKLKEISERN